MSDFPMAEAPVRPASFRQLALLLLDGSTSMRELVDSMLGASKADAANIAVRELMSRFKASTKAANFSFAFVDFHDTVSHRTPVLPVADIDDNGDFDPTRHGTGGTFIGSALEAAGEISAQFLGDVSSGLPSSVVVLLLTDGECLHADRTKAIAAQLKADDRIAVAAAFFGTKGRTSNGPALLKEICSDPVRFYKTVYDAETLRSFFEASMTAAASRHGLVAAEA